MLLFNYNFFTVVVNKRFKFVFIVGIVKYLGFIKKVFILVFLQRSILKKEKNKYYSFLLTLINAYVLKHMPTSFICVFFLHQ